jgi:hypothetical protein
MGRAVAEEKGTKTLQWTFTLVGIDDRSGWSSEEVKIGKVS